MKYVELLVECKLFKKHLVNLYYKVESCKANTQQKLPKTERYWSLKLSLQGMGGISIFGDTENLRLVEELKCATGDCLPLAEGWTR